MGVTFKGYIVVAELSCDKSSFRSGMFGEGFWFLNSEFLFKVSRWACKAKKKQIKLRVY